MRRLFLLFPVLLAGCHGSREKDVVGHWTLPSGVAFDFDAAKTYRVQTSRHTGGGTWSIEGDRVVVTQTTIEGKSIDGLKAALQKGRAKLPAALQATVDRIGEPENYVLSSDGRTMTKSLGGKMVSLTKG